MNCEHQVSLAAAFLLATPFLAQAQTAIRMPAPMAPAQRFAAAPIPVAQQHRPSSGVHVVRPVKTQNASAPSSATVVPRRSDQGALGVNGNFNSGVPLSLQDVLNQVPGLGFDYENLAAINQDLAIKAAIDPATQWRLFEAGRFRTAGSAFPGFYLLDGGGGYYEPAPSAEPEQEAQPQSQPQPQIIVLQQAPSAEQAAPQSSPDQMSQTPLPDEGEFTLVLRSGAKIQAVAFTRTSDKIVYITPDGGRKTVGISDIDTEATLRLNQEHGTPLQLPL
jgi:hypothetical protein